MLLVVAVLLAGVGTLLGRVEHPRKLRLDPERKPTHVAVWIALASAFIMPFAEISHPLTAAMAAAGAVGSIIAVVLLNPTRRPVERVASGSDQAVDQRP